MADNYKVLLLIVYNNNMLPMYEDIGVASIAAVLRQKGYQVLMLGKDEEYIDYDQIVKFNPNIVGMPVYNLSKESVYRVSRRLKELIPEAAICIGGCLPTYRGVDMLKETADIDFAIKGEGEYVMLELVRRLESGEDYSGIKGLIYKALDQVIENEDQELIQDLNDLPLPARDLIPDNKLKIALMSTSRGCTANCSFCACKLFWKKWRGRDVNHIVDEIEMIINNYGIRTFNFIDCSFEDPGYDYQRLTGIAKEIIRRDLKISYFADMRAEFQRRANDEIMELLKESGMCGVVIGIESANEENLKLYNKIATVQDNIKAVELFQRYDMHAEIGFIIFNPYTTFEGVRKDIAFLRKYRYACNTDYFASRCRFAAFKGSALHNKIKAEGLFISSEYDEYGYRFIDERIGILADYMSNYIIEANAGTNYAFVRIPYYSTRYPTLLAHYKRQYKDNEKAYSAILNAEKVNNEIRNDLNETISAWVSELTDLAERSWDIEKADSISRAIIGNEYLLKAANSYDNGKNMLLLRLIRAGLSENIMNVYEM